MQNPEPNVSVTVGQPLSPGGLLTPRQHAETFIAFLRMRGDQLAEMRRRGEKLLPVERQYADFTNVLAARFQRAVEERTGLVVKLINDLRAQAASSLIVVPGRPQLSPEEILSRVITELAALGQVEVDGRPLCPCCGSALAEHDGVELEGDGYFRSALLCPLAPVEGLAIMREES